MIFLKLFYEFFKVGLFAVGGGMATFPFLTDLADKTGWYTQQQLIDMIAIAESTPGPIGVNTATYVGFTIAGIPGAVIASLGLITPSFLIILIISMDRKTKAKPAVGKHPGTPPNDMVKEAHNIQDKEV